MSTTQVGSITLINLTLDELIISVNSQQVTHVLPGIERRSLILVEGATSPVPADAQVAYGYHPVYRTFLRSVDPRPGYFNQGINTVCVEQRHKGYLREYHFSLGSEPGQNVDTSATLSISYDAFIVTGPAGKNWVSALAEQENPELLP